MNKIKLFSIALLLTQLMISQGTFHKKVVEVEVQLKKKEVVEQIKQLPSPTTTSYQDDYHVNELLYFGSTPIVINNVLHSQLTLYEKEYYSLPLPLKNSINKITITSKNLNSACGINSAHKVKGCARSEFNDILLDETYRYGDLLHECIHLYSYLNNRVFSNEFASIYQEEGSKMVVQVGNTHNIYEFYVSAYLLYLQNPNYLARIAPKCKSYFDRT